LRAVSARSKFGQTETRPPPREANVFGSVGAPQAFRQHPTRGPSQPTPMESHSHRCQALPVGMWLDFITTSGLASELSLRRMEHALLSFRAHSGRTQSSGLHSDGRSRSHCSFRSVGPCITGVERGLISSAFAPRVAMICVPRRTVALSAEPSQRQPQFQTDPLPVR
jgi:hypothetical protein